MRVKHSFIDLNFNNQPYSEEVWRKNNEELVKKASAMGSDELPPEVGFHMTIENEDITLWNGKKRIYIPMMAVGLSIPDDTTDIKSVLSKKKAVLKSRFADFFEENLQLLPLSVDEIVDLIIPHLLSFRFVNHRNTVLYVEGDIKDGKLSSMSVSTYFVTKTGEKGASFIVNYAYDETNEPSEMRQLLLKAAKDGIELNNLYLCGSLKY